MTSPTVTRAWILAWTDRAGWLHSEAPPEGRGCDGAQAAAQVDAVQGWRMEVGIHDGQPGVLVDRENRCRWGRDDRVMVHSDRGMILLSSHVARGRL